MNKNNSEEFPVNTILFLLDDPGKDRHFQHYVLQGLKKASINPLVTYFTGDASTSSIALSGYNVTGLCLSLSWYKHFNPLPIFRLIKLIKKTGCRLVHVQRHRALIYAGIACRLTGTKLLYSIRATELIRNTNRLMAFNMIKPALCRIIAVSQGAKLDFISRTGFPKNLITVVSNGIDLDDYQIKTDKLDARKRFNIPDGCLAFGMAARFKEAKDHPGLLRAFREVLEKVKAMDLQVEPMLTLAGDGPTENSIKRLATELAIDDKVKFLGRLDPLEIPIFLKTLDIFIHPSFREGMPASVLEAMAAGLPLISTDVEGITDIFNSDRDFGRMVKRGDVSALAEAMTDLLSLNPSKRAEMGFQGIERLKEGFTREHMVKGTVDVYRDLLGC